MNDKVSILSLIFQSTKYAEFVYNSVMKYTPEIQDSMAEFFFVANDATKEVLNFLKEKEYPHYIKNNTHYSDAERFEKGFAGPEYCGRVYMGYNYGIQQAKNPVVVWVNSDNCFSPDWLPNLKKRLALNTIVSPRIIQPLARFRNPINYTRCLVENFGTGPDTFNEVAFQSRVGHIKANTITEGNAFFPAMVYKENVEKVGYFPEGNLHNGRYEKIKYTGDTYFYRRLSQLGIKHITSNDSIVYHFDEGEKYLK
jgi:hypothetical protein